MRKSRPSIGEFVVQPALPSRSSPMKPAPVAVPECWHVGSEFTHNCRETEWTPVTGIKTASCPVSHKLHVRRAPPGKSSDVGVEPLPLPASADEMPKGLQRS